MTKFSQELQVMEKMRSEGGFATLKRLNEIIDFSLWKTKTPEASVRRIVQQSKHFFKIQPGLWALEESRDTVLKHFEIKSDDKQSEEKFTHSYYQGLLVEIGKFKKQTTYIPTQDKNKKYLHSCLGEIADLNSIPQFSYDYLLKKARTIDVIWFNERNMPSYFYEIEHTTDIKNSLSKFYELQDFHAGFYIVADKFRRKEFDDKLNVSMFDSIRKRVKFLDYGRIAEMYEGLKKVNNSLW